MTLNQTNLEVVGLGWKQSGIQNSVTIPTPNFDDNELEFNNQSHHFKSGQIMEGMTWGFLAYKFMIGKVNQDTSVDSV